VLRKWECQAIVVTANVELIVERLIAEQCVSLRLSVCDIKPMLLHDAGQRGSVALM
jgi:hypothetical protein